MPGSAETMAQEAPAEPLARRDRAVLWLLAAAIPLVHWRLLPSVGAADLALAVAVVVWARRTDLRRLPTVSAVCLASVGALWLWALIGGVWRAFGSPLPFSLPEFSRSFLKLSFYLVVATVVSAGLARIDSREVRRAVAAVLTAHAALALLLYAAMAVDPEAREALGADRPAIDHYYHLRWFGDSSPDAVESLAFPRARGLLREPARLGILHSLGLGLLLLGPRRPPRLGWSHLLIAASVVLSFSLSGYALLAAVSGLTAWRWRRDLAELLPPRRRLAAMLVAAAALLVVPPVGPTLYHAIGERAAGLLTGRFDASTKARLELGLRAGVAITAQAPVIGAGLGNFDVALEALRDRLPRPALIPPGSQGWNVLAYLAATTGIPGLLLFVAAVSALFHQRPGLACVFILSLFAWVGFLTAPFWIFLSLYLTAGAAREAPSRQPPRPDAVGARAPSPPGLLDPFTARASRG